MEKNNIKLYHGSEFIVEQPRFGIGNPKNDYGLGFYCTKYDYLAAEWACKATGKGYTNKYNFNCKGLKILNLNEEYHILNWLAILLKNRNVHVGQGISSRAIKYITDNFSLETKDYDVIIGYRADDSYFTFVRDFVQNETSLDQLAKAMYLGDLGHQYFIQTKEAFSRLSFIDVVFHSESEGYKEKSAERANTAFEAYIHEKEKSPIENQLFILDILREGLTLNDTRLQQPIYRCSSRDIRQYG